MKKRWIAAVGKLMSGKSTLAHALVEAHGFRQVALADGVKDQVVEMVNLGLRLNGVRQLTIDRDLIEKDKHVFRPVLQWWGTDWWRVYMEDDQHWIERLRQRVADSDEDLVIDDVRFGNEVAALREMGFVVVKVVRDETERQMAIRAKYVETPLGKYREELEISGALRDEVELAMDAKHAELDAKVAEILNHPSETEVDGLAADFTFYCADVEALRQQAHLLATGYHVPWEWDGPFDGPIEVVGIGAPANLLVPSWHAAWAADEDGVVAA